MSYMTHAQTRVLVRDVGSATCVQGEFRVHLRGSHSPLVMSQRKSALDPAQICTGYGLAVCGPSPSAIVSDTHRHDTTLLALHGNEDGSLDCTADDGTVKFFSVNKLFAQRRVHLISVAREHRERTNARKNRLIAK